MSAKNAKKFWESQTCYPKYGTITERRLFELNYLVPKILNKKSLLDLGCGDGSLIKCLKELTYIKDYYAFDISENLIKNIPAIKKIYDCYSPCKLPKTDVTIFSGVIPYIFSEKIIHQNFDFIKSEFIYIKAPCSMNKNILINEYSKKLNSKYSSIYRTIPKMINIISKHFEIIEINKIYPEDIESEFGTKQIAFICKNRKS
jgi:hypothetical protein